MNQEKYENKQKDDILQAFHDACEDAHWGMGRHRVVIKVVFDGYLSLNRTEIQSRQDGKNIV